MTQTVKVHIGARNGYDISAELGIFDRVQYLSFDGFKRFGRAGYDQGRWILLDFVDVVVHLFDSEYRDYYDLELLWGDAEKIDY